MAFMTRKTELLQSGCYPRNDGGFYFALFNLQKAQHKCCIVSCIAVTQVELVSMWSVDIMVMGGLRSANNEAVIATYCYII